MKSFLTGLFILFSIVFASTFTSCQKCNAPIITLDPSSGTMNAAPGQKITFGSSIRCEEVNIKSVTVSKKVNGVTSPNFLSFTNINTVGKSLLIVDSVDKNIAFGMTIEYTIKAISDCKGAAFNAKTFIVNIVPSSDAIPSTHWYANNQGPRIYSRFAAVSANNSAIQFVLSPAPCARTNADPNDQKDVCDTVLAANQFTSTTAKWSSRNGTRFVLAPSTFDYANASAFSVIDGFSKGIPFYTISVAKNDIILVNIKNQNKYAVVRIKDIIDGASPDEDYTFFEYKLAQ